MGKKLTNNVSLLNLIQLGLILVRKIYRLSKVLLRIHLLLFWNI